MTPPLGTQYARSADPAVMQAVHGRQQARRTFIADLRWWAVSHGIDPDTVVVLSSPWGMTFGGLATPPEGMGRWTKGRFGGQWEEVRASDALHAREEWQAHERAKEGR